MQKGKLLQKMIRPIENCIYAIKAKMSDVSQDFRPADILGVRQATKGFDESEFVTFYLNKSQQKPANKYGMDTFQKIKTLYLFAFAAIPCSLLE